MAPNGSTDRIVVGIDFGTTFSGVAAVHSGAAEAPDEINVIKSWPGGNNITSDKVPSEITYGPPPASRASTGTSTARDTPNNRPFADHFNLSPLNASLPNIGSPVSSASVDKARWGFQLRPEEDRLRCIKLLLDSRQRLPKYVSNRNLKDQLERAGKTAETVVSDYLTELWRHAHETLERRYGKKFMTDTKLDVVLTVPAVWSDAAKDATLRAATSAGMGENLALVSEPEAAAVYTLKSIQPNHLRVGNNFIVCDAGGGTVDLISYEIEQVTPLRIQESAEGTGSCCGAATLNMRFESHIRSMIGPEIFDRIRQDKPHSWQTALKYFEEYVKRNFDPEDIDNEFNVPFPLNDGEAPGVDQGFLTLSYADVWVVFHPVIEEISQLVQGQVDRLKARGKSVNGIVLVGGFGQSNCLFKCLQGRFKDLASPPPYPGTHVQQDQGQQLFEVMQPVNAWTAVVRGAVLRGLEGTELVLNRRSRSHYGVKMWVPFDSNVHPASCKNWDFLEEVYRADDRMDWFITKGQTCSSTTPISHTFYRTYNNDHSKKNATTELIICDEDETPDGYKSGRRSSTRLLCKLDVDLSKVPAKFWKHRTNKSGMRYQSLSYELGMQIQSGGLRFDLRVGGVTYGDVSASFN